MGGFLDATVSGSGAQILPLSPAIAAQAAQLPPEFPGDPCDRLIAATAQIHELSLVTADQRLRDLVSLRTVL